MDSWWRTLRECKEEIVCLYETEVDFDHDIDLPSDDEMPDRYWTMAAKQVKLTPRKLSDA